MEVEDVALSRLHTDDRNARKGNVQAIADSLKEFGQHRAIVAQRSTGKIIAGNHTFLAASALGWQTVSVHWVDDDDEKSIRRGIADNATGDLAVWDEKRLAELLQEVGTDVPGLSADVVDRVLSDVSGDSTEPIYPLHARPGEKYDYIVFYTDSELDSLYLQSKFGEMLADWKNPQSRPRIRSKIFPVSRLRQELDKNAPPPTQDEMIEAIKANKAAAGGGAGEKDGHAFRGNQWTKKAE
jgi:hypothetical protein